MRESKSGGCLAPLLAAALLIGSPVIGSPARAEADHGNRSVPVNRVLGKSYAEWAARWYERFFSFPEQENPANQAGAIDCYAGNRGPVWFLYGTTTFGFGDVPQVEYSCAVKQRVLFLPVLTIFFANFPGENFPVEQKRSFTKSVVDQTCALQVSLDGVPLEFSIPISRSQTRPYRVYAPNGYPSMGLPPGLPIDDPETVADGYWIALSPLPPGEHSLRYLVGGNCDGNGEPQAGVEVTYHLTVVGGG